MAKISMKHPCDQAFSINRYRAAMVRPHLVVLLGFVGLSFLIATPALVRTIRSQPVDSIEWLTNLEVAKEAATQSGKPVLMKFTADWCGPCVQMKQSVFSDPDVGSLINDRFVPVVVDVTNPGSPSQAVANRHGVQALPTLVLLSPNGAELARKIGYVDASELLDWLNASGRTVWRHADPTRAGH